MNTGPRIWPVLLQFLTKFGKTEKSGRVFQGKQKPWAAVAVL